MFWVFRALYVIGVMSAGALVVAGFLNRGVPVDTLILPLALAHMAVLIVFGIAIRATKGNESGRYVGERVQTAGYLHTLIGFAAALVVVGGTAPTLDALLQPMGAALVTSVLGWLFGGEIAQTKESSRDARQTMEDTIDVFTSFVARMQTRQEAYLQALQAAEEAMAASAEAQQRVVVIATNNTAVLSEEVVPSYLEGIGEFQALLASIKITLSELAKEASNALGEPTIEALRSLGEGARGASVQVDRLSGIIEQAAGRATQIVESLQTMSEFTGQSNTALQTINAALDESQQTLSKIVPSLLLASKGVGQTISELGTVSAEVRVALERTREAANGALGEQFVQSLTDFRANASEAAVALSGVVYAAATAKSSLEEAFSLVEALESYVERVIRTRIAHSEEGTDA